MQSNDIFPTLRSCGTTSTRDERKQYLFLCTCMASLAFKLEAFVKDAQDVDAFINMLRHIPLQKVKNFIQQHIKVSDPQPEALRSMYYASFPADRILSTDAMQSVLSFLPHQPPLRSVNKHFKRLVHNNETLRKRARERNIASQFGGRNAWLVDPSRDHLNAVETQKGIKGPLESLQKALDRIESGDKILLAEGRHFLGKSSKGKDVRIEGFGECEITADKDNVTRDFDIEHKVSLSNVRIHDTCISVEEKGTL